jgi:hypothetical protein
MRVGRRSPRLRGLVYIPLTPRDEAVHGDLRYRVGTWLNTLRGSRFLGLTLFVAIGVPIGLLLDWRDSSGGGDRPGLYVFLILMWLWLSC